MRNNLVCIKIDGVCAQAGRLNDVKFHARNETLKDEKQHDAADKST